MEWNDTKQQLLCGLITWSSSASVVLETMMEVIKYAEAAETEEEFIRSLHALLHTLPLIPQAEVSHVISMIYEVFIKEVSAGGH